MAEEFDLIVIGAGQAGGPLAGAFARAGRRTALVETAHVGGTCINEGCPPTKTMVASARVAYLARRAADYGVQTGSGLEPAQQARFDAFGGKAPGYWSTRAPEAPGNRALRPPMQM